GTVSHAGSLGVGESYEQVATVTIPEGVSGEYFITPWADTYDFVLEDTLATNLNPDDPNEVDNNNYKARPITVLGSQVAPDLAVPEVIAPGQAKAGDPFPVEWTVANVGTGPTTTPAWVDRILLSTTLDPRAPGARTRVLGQVVHSSPVAAQGSYTGQETFTLP